MGFACSMGDKARIVVEMPHCSLAVTMAQRSLEQI